MPKTCVRTLQHTDGTRRLEQLIARTNPSHHVQHLTLILSVKMLSPRAVVNNPPRFQGPIGAGVWLISVHTAMPFCAMVMKNCNVHLRLTPILKKPPPKKKETHKQTKNNTFATNSQTHTLSSNYKGTLPYLNSFASFLFTGLCNDPFAQHTPTTSPARKPRQIFCHTIELVLAYGHTRAPTKPQKNLTSALQS